MSAQSTLVSSQGTAAQRSPGNRLHGTAAGLTGTRVKYLIPPLIALLVVAAIQVGGTLFSATSTTPNPAADVLARDDGAGGLIPVTEVSSIGGVDTSDTDRRIAFWQDRLSKSPRSDGAWVNLGDLYDIKGRQTGDLSQYVLAQQAYQHAIEVYPQGSAGHSGAARILATLHDFAGALGEATTVLEIDPSANSALAVVFDASLELGDVDNARVALDKLDDRIQTPAVMVRQARLDFLNGSTATAASLVDEAVDEAAADAESPSSLAFYRFVAAEYELLAGDIDAADAGYAAALDALPNYPLAIYGQGRVAYARGDLTTAISRLETAVAALPRPDMLAFLGDLYALYGDAANAADEYATIDFIAGMAATTAGTVYDREYGLYLSDHAQNTSHALELAQSESQVRHDVYGHDALAWALHANGRDSEALAESQKARELGTVDPKLLIHAGIIELANGLTDAGRAHIQHGLDLHPAFSPLVVQAAREAIQ